MEVSDCSGFTAVIHIYYLLEITAESTGPLFIIVTATCMPACADGRTCTRPNTCECEADRFNV